MRILISGGGGYIGSRLAADLSRAGHDVIVGSRSTVTLCNFSPHLENVKMNWDDQGLLTNICKGVDVVIHAAGMNAQNCLENPKKAIEFNGLVTARFVNAAEKAGVERFIYLSTAHVYARPLVGLVTENTSPNNCHPYALSNLSGEYNVLDENNRSSMQGVILRISNVFGAPEDPNLSCWRLVVNDLCRQSVEKKKLSLTSSENEVRDFISLSCK